MTFWIKTAITFITNYETMTMTNNWILNNKNNTSFLVTLSKQFSIRTTTKYMQNKKYHNTRSKHVTRMTLAGSCSTCTELLTPPAILCDSALARCICKVSLTVNSCTQSCQSPARVNTFKHTDVWHQEIHEILFFITHPWLGLWSNS